MNNNVFYEHEQLNLWIRKATTITTTITTTQVTQPLNLWTWMALTTAATITSTQKLNLWTWMASLLTGTQGYL